MILSDSQLDALVASTENLDQKFGVGIVLLLIDEVRQRRAAEMQDMQTAIVEVKGPLDLSQTSATNLIQELTTCIKKNEPLRDADVLDLFHSLQNREYFQTTCLVDREALKKLLYVLSAPEQPHLLREMQATRGLPTTQDGPRNPIDQLIMDQRRPTHAST